MELAKSFNLTHSFPVKSIIFTFNFEPDTIFNKKLRLHYNGDIVELDFHHSY